MPDTGTGFVVVGESLVDIVVPVAGDRRDAVGGSSLNVAVGLSRLGVPTTLVTRIGEDAYGERVQAHLRDSGVRLSSSSLVAGGDTSTATASLDEQHVATYEFDLVWDMASMPLPDDALGVHLGSLGTLLEPGRDAAIDLGRQAAGRGGFVSYDPNVRPFFVGDDLDGFWRDVRAIGADARLLKLSDEDVRHLRLDEDEVCRTLLAGRATELVVLTRGPQGARAYTERGTVEVGAPRTEVADTVGAGDSFMASMIATLTDWGVVAGGAGSLAALEDAAVERLVSGAVTAAAVTCSRPGADPPRRADLPSWWGRRPD